MSSKTDAELLPGLDPELVVESAEALYENAPCGYITTLPDGLVARVNRTFLAWMGYTREELVGRKRFQDLLTVGCKIFHETHWAPLLRMQGSVREIQLDLRRKDGRTLPTLANTDLACDAAGRPCVVRTTLFDISDRKRYERELVLARKRAEAAAKAKADVLSMISHEIRTPMSAILGAAQLLERSASSDKQRRLVAVQRSASERILRLLDDLLDLSKIEAGKISLELREFDVRALAHETAFALEAKAEEKKLSLGVDVDHRVPPVVVGDALRLGQVLTNLVGNAIKFTAKGGVDLHVTWLEAPEPGEVTLRFSVHDTGIGIPADRIAGIFEEFDQGGHEIGARYGGTGLGLSISRKLLELQGSTMEVQSEPGEGSTFSFVLRMPIGRTA